MAGMVPAVRQPCDHIESGWGVSAARTVEDLQVEHGTVADPDRVWVYARRRRRRRRMRKER